jgi:hypothetical protein
VNPPQTDFVMPRDDDAALPRQSEPLGGLLAMLGALYEEGVRAVYVRGALAGFRSVLEGPLALIPHDAVLPGVLTTGDLSDVAAALAPRPVRLEGLVDGSNRRLGERAVREMYRRGGDVLAEPSSPAHWLLPHMRTPPR